MQILQIFCIATVLQNLVFKPFNQYEGKSLIHINKLSFTI